MRPESSWTPGRRCTLRTNHDSRIRWLTSGGGSVARAAAGAVRIANVVAAAFANRRVLEHVEARSRFASFPRLVAYPLVPFLAWIAGTLIYRGYKLHRTKVQRKSSVTRTSRKP